jgi:4-hydroxybenzoate polyprenyltransferase
MQKLINKIFEHIIFGNWFVAFASVSLTLETYLMINRPLRIDALLTLIFLSTLFIYNLHRYIGFPKTEEDKAIRKDIWHVKNSLLFKYTFYATIAGIIVCVFFISKIVLIYLSPLGILAIAYTVPLIKKKSSRINLRSIPGLKILFIGLVWGLTTVVLPMVDDGISIFNPTAYYMIARRILFIIAITIPFDIRDTDFDIQQSLVTIPILLGVKKSKILAYVLLIIFSILIYTQYGSPFVDNESKLNFSIPLYFSALSTAFLISFSSKNNGKYFHYFWLDGTMIFQFLLIIAYKII